MLLALCALASAHGQAASPALPATPDVTVNARLVLVPALVRSSSGGLVHSLTAQDFTLLDDGKPQQLSLNETEAEPLALVVVLQTGGVAREHLADYARLPTMLSYLTAGRSAQVALVTFDSQPEEEWDFTSNLDDLEDGLAQPEPGDRGAAILQAVDHAIGMLQQQPPTRRRVILLLSQTHDDSSKLPSADVLRRLGENDIIVLSATFSPEKDWLKHQFTQPRSGEKPYQMAPNLPSILYTFNLSTPLGMALRALRTDAAATISSLSGGESVSFADRRSLEQQLAALANDLPGRYALSFRPSSDAAGFHALQVSTPGHPGFHVLARSGYWAAALPAPPQAAALP